MTRAEYVLAKARWYLLNRRYPLPMSEYLDAGDLLAMDLLYDRLEHIRALRSNRGNHLR